MTGSKMKPGHEDATPERLAKGDTAASKAGTRIAVDPLTRAATRGQLDRRDASSNSARFVAGSRLRARCHCAGHHGVRGIDYSRVRNRISARAGITDSQSASGAEVAKARASLGEALWDAVHAFVVEERPAGTALEAVRVGLERLSSLWRMRN